MPKYTYHVKTVAVIQTTTGADVQSEYIFILFSKTEKGSVNIKCSFINLSEQEREAHQKFQFNTKEEHYFVVQ
jgi:hypothetical protein